ncbi:hypothetical protein BGZ49_000146, partial [Haplosporangium sp. Z 27]
METDPELGISHNPCASNSTGKLANSTPSHPIHQRDALEDMLNTELVEERDAAIAKEEAREAGLNKDSYNDLGLYATTSYPPSYDSGIGSRMRCHAKLMRQRDRGTKVTNVELFFDLVFVYAISAISDTMEEDLSLVVVLEMLLVTLAVWWAWVFSAWTFNWFNPDSYLVRLLLLALMLASLIMSAFISESFGDESFLFALIAVLWLVGGAIGGNTRNVLWTIAIIFEYISAATGFYTPVLGKSLTSDWDIHGGHLAERCSLFIIIALGESVVVTGDSFKTMFHEPAGVGMFIVAFLGAAAMWWIYFHTAASEAVEYVENSSDPGRMGRVGYTYIHVLMVIGIIWTSVGDRISIVEPYMIPHHHDDKMMTVAIMIGGPALFVLGHGMFRHTFCPKMPYAHVATILAL